jgi:hypothetical protein
MKNFSDGFANGTNSTNSSASNATSLRGRVLLEISKALTSDVDGIIPLVFYGTAFAVVINFVCNFMFAIFFLMVMRKD